MPVVKLWKFADKITQVCSCLLIKDPKKREKMRLMELQCFVVETLRED